MQNNPLRYNDPSGHDVGCPGRDASECQERNNKLSNKKIQQKVYEKHRDLRKEVDQEKINDLEALEQLSNFTASFYANDSESYVRNMGAVLTGLSTGNTALTELMVRANIPNAEYTDYYLFIADDNGELKQSGYDEIFMDPNYPEFGGNQAHHYWFYVQVCFESGLLTSNLGNISHETILGDPKGMSKNDFALGFEGSKVGKQLSTGNLKPQDVGDYLYSSLKPGSPNAQLWRFIIGMAN